MDFLLGAAIGGAFVWFFRPAITSWWTKRNAPGPILNDKPPPKP